MTGPDSLEASSHSKDQSKDEQELSAAMRLTQKGDAKAYQVLLGRLKAMLESYVRNTLSRHGRWALASTDDIVQDALLGIHAKRHTYDPNKPFLPWFYAIARYKIIDSLRAGTKHRRDIELDQKLADSLPDTSPGPLGGANSTLAWADTETLIQELSDKQRKILEMVKIQGLSVREAAERSGYSVSDIKVTVHRAIKTLQKKIRSMSDEPS